MANPSAPKPIIAAMPYINAPESRAAAWAASNGSRTGTQGKGNAALRALIPYGLSLAMCLAVEKDKGVIF